MELFSPGHLVVLAIIVAVLFFGWKQLPDMSRSLGRSLRILKTEVKGMTEDDKARESARTDSTATQAEQPAPQAQPRALPAAPVAPAAAARPVATPVAPAARAASPRPRPTPRGSDATAGAGQSSTPR